MVKLSLFPLLLLTGSLMSPRIAAERTDYRSFLKTELNERGNYTVVGIKPEYSKYEDIRIYKFDEEPIDAIADNAFIGVSFDSIVLSRDITHLSSAVFENAPSIENIYYTGSKAEFEALNLSFPIENVDFYSVDEGFINYWNANIRPSADTNICDISEDTYKYCYGLYKNLEKGDLDVVNDYKDLAGFKISESMKELSTIFSHDNSQKRNDEWNQTGAITLIIVIAVIGMTSITIFFLLKTKNIIH